MLAKVSDFLVVLYGTRRSGCPAATGIRALWLDRICGGALHASQAPSPSIEGRPLSRQVSLPQTKTLDEDTQAAAMAELLEKRLRYSPGERPRTR